MALYRKKPVVIEAVQLILVEDGKAYFSDCGQPWPDDWPSWDVVTDAMGPCIPIDTLEGTMLARPGDWIIKERFPTGERQFYPCKPDIFAATYEPANEVDATQMDPRATEVGRFYESLCRKGNVPREKMITCGRRQYKEFKKSLPRYAAFMHRGLMQAGLDNLICGTIAVVVQSSEDSLAPELRDFPAGVQP